MNGARVYPFPPVSRKRAGDEPAQPAAEPSGGLGLGALAILVGGLAVVAYVRRQQEADAEQARLAELEEEVAALERNEAASREALYARAMRPPWGF